jgi:hypothetical protein
MKRILLIVPVLFVSMSMNAGRKFLIETERSVNTVKLINKGKTVDLLPEHNNKTNFIFEVDNIDNIFLKFSIDQKIKLYSFSDKEETDWHPVVREKEIAVKSFFNNIFKRDVELSDFLLNSFRTNYLNNTEDILRGINFFYTPGDINFPCPEKLSIAWKSGGQVLRLKLEILLGKSEIYSTQTYNDTILQFKNLPENVQKSLRNETNYRLSVKSKSIYGYNENQLSFRIDSFCFTKNSKDLIFIHEQNIDIRWEAPEKETSVTIYDDENKIVYEAQTSQKFCSFNELSKIAFKYKKPYKIVLTQGNKTISEKFHVLFNYQKFNELTNK